MKADTLTLSTIFGKDVRYVVPLYQRPYVWEQDRHWGPLVEDVFPLVDSVAEGSASVTPIAPHFMGAIVLEQLETVSASFEERSIIDGQQRLTTLQLFVAAASRVAAQHGAEAEARVMSKLVWNDQDLVTASEHLFKVWPTNANRDAFQAVMQEAGPDPSSPDD